MFKISSLTFVGKMSDYTKWGKAYYEAHKSEILAKEKDSKRWLSYYERNKDAVKERARKRYYESKGVPVPEVKPKIIHSIPDRENVKRLEELVAELRELVPQVVKPKRKKARTFIPAIGSLSPPPSLDPRPQEVLAHGSRVSAPGSRLLIEEAREEETAFKS